MPRFPLSMLAILLATLVVSPAAPAATQEASPPPTQQISTEECERYDDWSATLGENVAAWWLAGSEAGLLAIEGEFDPAAVDLPPAIARELADLADEFVRAQRAVEVPESAPAVQAANEAVIVSLTAAAAQFRAYADADEGGADPGEALAAVLADPEYQRLTTQQFELIDGLNRGCYPGDDATVADGRQAVALLEAAVRAQEGAEIPAVVGEADDALRAFLETLAVNLGEYADRVEAGEDEFALLGELGPPVVRSAVAADEPIRDLLERCGVPVGVTQPDDGIPALSDQECAGVFAWYEATALRLADFNSFARERYAIWEQGIALPGGAGSVDLDEALAQGEAATPAASPDAPPAATPAASPAATPQLSAAECQEFADWRRAEQERYDDLQVAFNEAGVGAVTAEFDLAAVDLDPAIARELAALIDQTSAEMRTVAADVPAFYLEFHDAFLATFDAMATAFRDYASAVEGGADPDEEIAAWAATIASAGAGASELILGLRAACDRDHRDPASAREWAAQADAAIQAQTAAETPAVAQEATAALISFLDAFAAAATDYADRVDAGEDPGVVELSVLDEAIQHALAADELLRGLLERCGVPVGVSEPDDGVPPLSEQECEQAFAWYEATAERLADFNAALRADLINLTDIGIALPGNLGSIDLDAVGDQARAGA